MIPSGSLPVPFVPSVLMLMPDASITTILLPSAFVDCVKATLPVSVVSSSVMSIGFASAWM